MPKEITLELKAGGGKGVIRHRDGESDPGRGTMGRKAWRQEAGILSDGRGQRRGRGVGQAPVSCGPQATLRTLDFI